MRLSMKNCQVASRQTNQSVSTTAGSKQCRGKRQQGFTLIELMIVVAIIGILAAIAIPAYKIYIIKGKMAEPITLMNTIRKAISVHISEGGQWPVADDTGESLVPLLGPIRIQGIHVEAISSNGKDAITARMRNTLDPEIANKTISLQFFSAKGINQGKWTCVRGILSEPIPDRYLTTTCLNDYKS